MKVKKKISFIATLVLSVFFLIADSYGKHHGMGHKKQEKYNKMLDSLDLTTEQRSKIDAINEEIKKFHEQIDSEKEALKEQKKELLEKKYALFIEAASNEAFTPIFQQMDEIRKKRSEIKAKLWAFYNKKYLEQKDIFTKKQREIYVEFKKEYKEKSNYSCKKGGCKWKKKGCSMCSRKKSHSCSHKRNEHSPHKWKSHKYKSSHDSAW